MKSPVLFLIFKREDTTKRVFERIREARPPKLYIAADGPRANVSGEKEKCERTRAIVNNIDWPCEIHKLFQDHNLGCGKGVSTAISWFFDHETEGIIIEDDILPHIDFFKYCDEMLERYRDDERIELIAGRNAFYNGYQSDVSYYMSSLFHIWGWATWKRVWNSYEFDTRKIQKDVFMTKMAKRLPMKTVRYYESIFDMMNNHGCDTWDYQLFFNQIMFDRYTIMSYKNLTENIGIGSQDAAHTTNSNDKEAIFKSVSPYPLIHPDEIKTDNKADLLYCKNFGLYKKSFANRIITKIKNKLMS